MSRPRRIKVHRLCVLPNIPAGMNLGVVANFWYLMRSSSWDPDPIVVRREGRMYRIIDGRHRFMAAIIAGRTSVLAVVEE